MTNQSESMTTVDQAATVQDSGYLSYRTLIWRRFRKNRMGIAAGVVLAMFYFAALFAGTFSPYDHNEIRIQVRYLPPQDLHFDWSGGFYVNGLTSTQNPVTLELEYETDPSRRYPVRFLSRDGGGDFRLIHSEGPMYLLGTDRMGRDLLSRMIHGGRVSLTVGIIGVFLSLILGSVLGTLSGYFGGWIDHALQRVVEILASFPPIPLWMALGAALPAGWTSIETYLGITIILSIISWGGLAREVRGKVLVFREQDYTTAARSAGAGHWYIISRHLMPGCYSHIIVVATLAIPGMILGETALSFLGLGIRPPMTSWGVLLEEAQR
ncbi:MAG: ABC transporter permease, partial [Gemmatimonadota bacterium]|nr:ABC transporter permease [Gemmatimonadota bacterium]